MTGTGRYCPPRICWCGECAWWQPRPEPDYARLTASPDRASEKHRRSWAQRDEPTWIEGIGA